MDITSTIIATLSLFISGYAIYTTSIKKGKVRITHPTIISFLYDLEGHSASPKVFFRGLLYSTANRGNIVENLFVKLSDGESTTLFSNWGYGTSDLVRGSGLFIPKQGVVHNHHFPIRNDDFNFSSEEYHLEIYATVFGKKSAVKLFEYDFIMKSEDTKKLSSRSFGILFNWNPVEQKYESEEEKWTAEKLGKLLLA